MIVQSFDYRTLHAMKKLAPSIRLSALYEGDAPDYVAIEGSRGNHRVAGLAAGDCREGEGGPRGRPASSAGIANRPQDWEKLAAAHVDAIISDDPAALISWLKAQGLR